MTSELDDILDFGEEQIPVVAVFSDSRGATAKGVVKAAVAQFDPDVVMIKRLAEIRDIDDVRIFLNTDPEGRNTQAVFHTIVDDGLRTDIREECAYRGIPSIDLLGPAISVIAAITGDEPKNIPGVLRNTEARYERRQNALDFYASHDNGAGLDTFDEADVILIGMPKSQKSPLALYLAFAGVKVANLDIHEGDLLPKKLYEIPRRRIFGLRRTVESLSAPPTGNSEVPRVPEEKLWALEASLEWAVSQMEELGCEIICVDDQSVEAIGEHIITTLRSTGHLHRTNDKDTDAPKA